MLLNEKYKLQLNNLYSRSHVDKLIKHYISKFIYLNTLDMEEELLNCEMRELSYKLIILLEWYYDINIEIKKLSTYAININYIATRVLSSSEYLSHKLSINILATYLYTMYLDDTGFEEELEVWLGLKEVSLLNYLKANDVYKVITGLDDYKEVTNKLKDMKLLYNGDFFIPYKHSLSYDVESDLEYNKLNQHLMGIIHDNTYRKSSDLIVDMAILAAYYPNKKVELKFTDNLDLTIKYENNLLSVIYKR